MAYNHETTKQVSAVTCQSEQKRTGSIQQSPPKGQHFILTIISMDLDLPNQALM